MASDAETPLRKRRKRAVEQTATSSRPKRVATTSARQGEQEPKRGSGRSAKAAAAKTQSTSTKKPEKARHKQPDGSLQGSDRKASTLPVNGSAKQAKNEKRDDSPRSYWLMKAEPESRFEKGVDVKFSIDDLREATEPEPWDGVRNPAARNNMRAMKKGDLAFFYHSNCKVPGVAGVMEIVKEHSVDESAFDPAHPYYDEKSTRENPKWEVVHVEFISKFRELIRLVDLKSHAKPGGPLENLQMVRQSRLSVSSVSAGEWDFIMALGEQVDGDEKS